MKRPVLSALCLLIAILVVGCTKSPTTPSKPQSANSVAKDPVAADTTKTKDLPVTPPAALAPDAAAADAAKATPAAAPKEAATPEMNAPATGGTDEPAKSDVPPPTDAAAVKLPFEDLVVALGDEKVTELYRDYEKQLAEKPDDLFTRVQRTWFLNRLGVELLKDDKRDKGMEAFKAALEQAQAVVAKEPSLPEDISEAFGIIYYSGACEQAAGGKAEDARATLVKAVELGFSNLKAIKYNEELAAVRALAGFDQQLDSWFVADARKVLATGESFPFDFNLTDLSGQNISLAGYRGKVLMVNIWGTWCPTCREEIPTLVKLQTQYGPQGMQLVGLNDEQTEDVAEANTAVQKFVQENGINYPCAVGTPAIKQQVPNFEGFPTTLFIDRTGKVRATVVNMQEYVFFEAIVKALLEEVAPP
ncbi:MAG: TlpA disulfide reductase family protein, partial [Pirellulaceae bacterium]